ncbi:MAG TPA: hypothetical protein VN823_08735 [Stellaceae bacterium]|nr:hypothetical protein [Stellaceae bacterium]
MNHFAARDGEMMRLVVGTAGHDADEAEPADMRGLLGIDGGDR